VRRDPEGALPAGELGFALFRVSNYAGAAEYLEDSLRKRPDDPVLWALLGASLDETGRAQGAVYALETAVFAKPDYGWAWGRLGKALRALGRHEEAVGAYEKSVEHGFAPPVVWSDLGQSAAELRDVPRLRRACRELGRLDAGMAKSLRRKLRSLTSKGRAPAAPEGGGGRGEVGTPARAIVDPAA
jgi:Flp pilus assembly protein TadD